MITPPATARNNAKASEAESAFWRRTQRSARSEQARATGSDRAVVEEPAEVVGQSRRRWRSGRRGRGQRLRGRSSRGRGGSAGRQPRRPGLAAAGSDDSSRSRPAKDGPQREQLVQRRAQAVDVGPVVDLARSPAPARGSCTGACPSRLPVRSGRRRPPTGPGRSRRPRGSRGVDQQVRRLDVAVDDAGRWACARASAACRPTEATIRWAAGDGSRRSRRSWMTAGRVRPSIIASRRSAPRPRSRRRRSARCWCGATGPRRGPRSGTGSTGEGRGPRRAAGS